MSIMESMGLDPEEVSRSLQSPKRARTDPRVCACGHGARAHSSQSNEPTKSDFFHTTGREWCQVTRLDCPCGEFDPVAVVEDVRILRFKTTGPGLEHALTRGIRRAEEKGQTVRLLAEGDPELEGLPGRKGWACKGCGVTPGPGVVLTPVGISEHFQELHQPAKINGLLCATCRENLRNNFIASQKRNVKP